MAKDPLSEHFDLDAESMLDDVQIEIPEDKEERDLDLIIDYALKAYKELMEIMQFIEPKNKLKYYEQAERFLAQAKDARFKRDKLILDKEKANKTAGSKQKKAEGSEENSPEENTGTVSRKELAERAKVRRVK